MQYKGEEYQESPEFNYHHLGHFFGHAGINLFNEFTEYRYDVTRETTIYAENIIELLIRRQSLKAYNSRFLKAQSQIQTDHKCHVNRKLSVLWLSGCHQYCICENSCKL
jgi:hypothetical protein